MLISELEARLFERFPRGDAEAWDHVGLSVGTPEAEVRGVCCALDATVQEVRAASRLGCTVLLTHHPLYLSAPDAVTPLERARPACGAALLEAARAGVSVISMHTNLDRSHEARACLPGLLGLAPASSLEHPGEPERTGYGALCEVLDEGGEHLGLDAFATRVAHAFGTEPRVWGEPTHPVRRVAFMGGSLGDFGSRAAAAGADAVVCGEVGYHRAQDLALRGIAVLELGHDRSEQPFCGVLADAAARAGVPRADIVYAPCARAWRTVTPERI